MLNCAEQVQIQKCKPYAYRTPKTACVQTIMFNIQLRSKDGYKKNTHKIQIRINLTRQINDEILSKTNKQTKNLFNLTLRSI